MMIFETFPQVKRQGLRGRDINIPYYGRPITSDERKIFLDVAVRVRNNRRKKFLWFND